MNKTKTMLKICSLLLGFFILASCSGVLTPGNANHDSNSEGFIVINLSLGDSSAFNFHNEEQEKSDNISKTFLPQSQSTKYYTLEFVSAENPKVTREHITTDTFSEILRTGTWDLTVTRYEYLNTRYYPVATGTKKFTVTAGSNEDVNVLLDPIVGGIGHFSYKVSSAIAVSGTLKLKQTKGTLEIIEPISISAGGTVQATLWEIPTGDYDVTVSLLTADGRGAGKYSSGRIFPGLVTESADFFTFTAANFVQSLNLAGKLNFQTAASIYEPASIEDNIKITAHDIDGVLVGTSLPFTWESNADEWIIKGIQPNKRSLYLNIEILASDGKKYITEKALFLPNVPDNGISNINTLTTGIYSIGPSSIVDSLISASVLVSGSAVSRLAASPGEKVTLTDLSAYGIKKGSLKYNSVNAVAEDNTFIMPAGAVNLAANFFNADLNGITITPSSNINTDVTWNTVFASATQTYNITVKNNVTGIQVNPVAADSDVTVSLSVSPSGSLANLSTNTATIVTITATPPSGLGGKGSKVYTLNITREKSNNCTLAALFIDAGNLYFNPAYKTYIVTVENSVDKINLNAIPSSNAASIEILKYDEYSKIDLPVSNPVSLDIGYNMITVKVTAEDGISAENYEITVIRPALSGEGTLTSIELIDTINAGNIIPPITVTGNMTYIREVFIPLDTIEINPVLSSSAASCIIVPLHVTYNMHIYSLQVTPDNGAPVMQYTLILNYE